MTKIDAISPAVTLPQSPEVQHSMGRVKAALEKFLPSQLRDGRVRRNIDAFVYHGGASWIRFANGGWATTSRAHGTPVRAWDFLAGKSITGAGTADAERALRPLVLLKFISREDADACLKWAADVRAARERRDEGEELARLALKHGYFLVAPTSRANMQKKRRPRK